VPHELPAAPIGFVGRDRELRRLRDVLGGTAQRDRTTVVATRRTIVFPVDDGTLRCEKFGA
jgi:hypothetical protein